MQRRQFLSLGAVAAATAVTGMPASAADKAPVSMTYVASWPSSNITTHIAARIIQEKLGYPTHLTSTDAGPMWAAVASGRADAMLTAWLPTTHQVYWDKYKKDVVDLGAITEGTWLGLAVPKYVPINTIAELEAHHARFKNRITGIEAGAGIMINTQKAIKAYGLKDMELLTSSTAAMQAQLKRAVERRNWIVVTAWKPLGIWAQFPLKTLEDPKHIYGVSGHIDAIINPKLEKSAPRVVQFLRDFKLPLDDIQAMMVELNGGKSMPEVTAQWISAHQTQVDGWTKA
ncbi:MAG: glycine betaine ABC transporter substrate-binding protein [Thiomonas sp.]|uniref:glycine betaine ABC transporter substrate-binding protein n=1 Tax=Thiomonas sp. TaxID=2047785 RepID=UPI002A36EBE9|nr:glycine betaine ABC transporter substrate-binding protein [Thiomonas sp.]MDY0330556.1 glycine betaine ABC transporter substrate-binding protein [Thiomonas sp.]